MVLSVLLRYTDSDCPFGIFTVKERYQLNYFICIKDFNAETNTSLKLNLFSFFICGNVVGIDMIRNIRIPMQVGVHCMS
jgi:hypothetical protein